MTRPCKFCLAAYPTLFEDGDVSSCEFEHRDDPRVYALAAAMARLFQPRPNTGEQVGWFLQDADAVVDDFDPPPAKWKLRKLPDDFGEFDARFRVNDVTYVVQHSDNKEKTTPVRLSTLQSWQRGSEPGSGRPEQAGSEEDGGVTRWPLGGAVQVPSGEWTTPGGFGASRGDQAPTGAVGFAPMNFSYSSW